VAARSLSAVGALGALVALTLSGCALTAQIETGNKYDASDGTGATVNGVIAQNMLLITSGVDHKAALVGSFYNETGSPVSVELTVENSNAVFTIPSMATITVGVAPGDKELITTSKVAPGLTSEITISVNKGDSSTEPLPVLDGTLPAYKGVLSELKAMGS
jgi:hypothetical protein